MTSALDCRQVAFDAALDASSQQQLAEVAKTASNLGAAVLMQHYGRLSSIESKGRVGDLVTNADLIVFLGWSWIIPNEITKKYLCVGIHPSDLPDYRGGSPIQHQIINGIIETKISLMTISEKLDGGDIWLKHDLDLRGDTIEIIFKNLEESSIALFNVVLISSAFA